MGNRTYPLISITISPIAPILCGVAFALLSVGKTCISNIIETSISAGRCLYSRTLMHPSSSSCTRSTAYAKRSQSPREKTSGLTVLATPVVASAAEVWPAMNAMD